MEVYRKINHVPTRMLHWGDPFSCDGKDVIICITGNPGIIDFYYEFSSELHKNTGFPVCLIGQAGHDIIPKENPIVLKGEEHLFDLEGQIDHKLDLITSYIDKKSKLHLIGHSIGAWLVIESLQKNPLLLNRVSSINLLFPTIQEMAVTKNALYLNKLLRFRSLVITFLIFFNMLPAFVLNLIASIYLKIKGLPSHYSERIIKYVNPTIIEKVLFLGDCELKRVKKLNTDGLEKVKHLTNVIYGETDGWVPLEYMEDLKPFEPFLKMRKVIYTHEFVLKSAEEVAELVSDFIKIKI